MIRGFWHRLPEFVDLETRQNAEAQLARLGGEHRPDELAKLADKLTDCLNPDGDFTDEDRARRRGITIGKQDVDGMSPISGYLTPEARATFDAVLAKLAAPGMCNPEDLTRAWHGTPSQDAIEGDTRSATQRNHDALAAAGRALLASGKLGQHNGLPASIIVTTTLQELEAGAGRGLTGGGTLLPMSDVIRMAAHAHHYLAIFDNGRALALYHTKRLASPAQRIMLYAKDRGCTRAGLRRAGVLTRCNHVTPWSNAAHTDIDDLTLACGPHHQLAERGWTTRTRGRASPNGSHQRTSTMVSPASTRSITPRSCLRRRRPIDCSVHACRIVLFAGELRRRLAKVAEMPSVRSLDGRNAAFHAAT